MVIANFFFGLLIIGAGVLSLQYNYQIVNSFGGNNWFERNLGSGSTYAVFKIFSVLLILFGLLMAFSLHDNLIEIILSPLEGIFKR